MLEDGYLHQRPIQQMVLNIADILFTCLFLMEMLMKWIGFGLKKYFSDAWCWFDFLILDVRLVNGFSHSFNLIISLCVQFFF